MTVFAREGIGVSKIAKELRKSGDFPGCYVILVDRRPIYVGISRGVLNRLRQHCLGKTHFDASLAYRMASAAVGHKLSREDAMQDPAVQAAFNNAQQKLRDAQVAFIEIQNDLEIYLFEAFCAMALDTSKWNIFRTH